MSRVLLAAILMMGASVTRLSSEVVTNQAPGDSFNYHLGPDVNNGANATLEVGGLNENRRTRSLVRFDPSSAISRGSTITSATFRLTTTRIDNFTSIGVQDTTNKVFTFSAYRILTTNWVEGNGGFQVVVGAVTWNSLRHTIEAWDVPGPDPAGSNIADTATATYVYTNTAWREYANRGFTWDVTTDVQAWHIDRSSALPSWVIISDKEATGTTNNGVMFASRQSSTNADYRPLLIIGFTPPPQGTVIRIY